MSRIEDAIEKASRMRNANRRGVDDNEKRTAACPDDSQSQLRDMAGRKAGGRAGVWILGGGITLAVLATGYFYYHGGKADLAGHEMIPANSGRANASAAAARQQSGVVSRKSGLRIPTGLLSGSPDRNYSTDHPGWQRYTSDAMEVRVYKEGGAVKAIQVISLVTEPISDDYVSTFLKECVGSGVWRIRSREEKNGFSIDKGSADEVTEVLIYRKKPEGWIKAFVIAFS